MSVGHTLRYKFPDKRNGRDYVTRVFGGQDEIIKWDESSMGVPQPDAATLAQWEQDIQTVAAEEMQERGKKKSAKKKLKKRKVTQGNLIETVQLLVDNT